ncbi:tRNA (adenine(22)-N(1))-methyltransferase [Evansella cellulosilytica]|uniref:SAM-dependent methyltransferase n=1 Tax=Evansella cellulosilytica (strain ATCC 21833 / DSM 2522 / FERM P-1141 / JCM 9156 / N-4) TaxID=649639 RepID=E6TW60_EVAC2|nr:tRNA (adenine(22)-N(1))-methyltransferase TrmK [Evansella cellulosilytica]ADU29883.1 protein of unknown function DUF633 [Evansella cellulosilytica DSM 2522]
MNENKLSKRLEIVASYVKKGSVVADIGSDHAYLPIFLLQNNIAIKAVAGEVNKGPLLSAKAQVERCHLENEIKVKLGDGLDVLKDEVDVDTVTIAGMGGPLISQILENGKHMLQHVNRLILQPNIAADAIRKWFLIEGWCLLSETIIEEDGHIYEILVAEKGDAKTPYSDEIEKELWLGPYLLKENSTPFIQKWKKEYEQLEKIASQINESHSTSKALLEKKKSVGLKMNWLREVLQ